MIYVCLWNLSVVLVDSSVSTNAQYWMALVSLVIFGITSFSTVFCKEAQYPISLLMAYVMIGITVALSVDTDWRLVFGDDRVDAVRITSLLIGSLSMIATGLRLVVSVVLQSRRELQRTDTCTHADKVASVDHHYG
jgi:hypothetical protein